VGWLSRKRKDSLEVNIHFGEEQRWTPERGKWLRSIIESDHWKAMDAFVELDLMKRIIDQGESKDFVEGWKACMNAITSYQAPKKDEDIEVELGDEKDSSPIQMLEDKDIPA